MRNTRKSDHPNQNSRKKDDQKQNNPEERDKKDLQNVKKKFLNTYDNILKMSQEEGGLTNELIDNIQDFVRSELQVISNSALRNIFNLIKDEQPGNLPIVRARLFYIAGKASKDKEKNKLRRFVLLLNALILDIDLALKNGNPKDTVKGRKASLDQFLEAIVAYHRFYGKS